MSTTALTWIPSSVASTEDTATTRSWDSTSRQHVATANRALPSVCSRWYPFQRNEALRNDHGAQITHPSEPHIPMGARPLVHVVIQMPIVHMQERRGKQPRDVVVMDNLVGTSAAQSTHTNTRNYTIRHTGVFRTVGCWRVDTATYSEYGRNSDGECVFLKWSAYISPDMHCSSIRTLLLRTVSRFSAKVQAYPSIRV